MYTRCQKPAACLHGSIVNAAMQHEWGDRFSGSRKSRPKPAAFRCLWTPLFGGLLARRVQRPRIVDFRHLVVAEAKNLTQDLVGMFAEQW